MEDDSSATSSSPLKKKRIFTDDQLNAKHISDNAYTAKRRKNEGDLRARLTEQEQLCSQYEKKINQLKQENIDLIKHISLNNERIISMGMEIDKLLNKLTDLSYHNQLLRNEIDDLNKILDTKSHGYEELTELVSNLKTSLHEYQNRSDDRVLLERNSVEMVKAINNNSNNVNINNKINNKINNNVNINSSNNNSNNSLPPIFFFNLIQHHLSTSMTLL
eukprot:TRINITY_DN4058_c0_g1_i5.p1 TRINITY_DN4058_c0_g1~~TRINITY_DN4058_c0_g1_i5.p1  ORF type:complete len:219 (+),score=42.49 TRINITY_DN4058_c0_g1_i5:3-659(+)